jgi:hypothetical protein
MNLKQSNKIDTNGIGEVMNELHGKGEEHKC